ncbi:uncharacterized protein DUF3306 [Hoeflea halophila]|uniref:Uncharacterized protein DUF3306 n=1 Tax=Hoeflea halophila TaxID=714899 RepID=A0A286IEH1_9HYPH|nr:DUF3306 domain-containing protein [Hoeflea halophila]SOE18427.1 uncharacterized protein DUF3306 [Hoeflea halophila]
MVEDKEGFLSRWSKRKQAQRANPGVDPDDEAPAAAPVVIDEEQLEAERSEAEANRLAAEAVDLDKVEYGFDFSLFMKRGVPDALRKKALKKFFNSNPVLANLDGLNDYDEDYNNPLHMVYKSSWDVGRGFLTEAERALQQATGRLTQERPQAEADEVDLPGEPETDAAEIAAEEQTGDEEHAAADSNGGQTGEVQPVDAPQDSQTGEAEQPQQKRVSIRQRLNG